MIGPVLKTLQKTTIQQRSAQKEQTIKTQISTIEGTNTKKKKKNPNKQAHDKNQYKTWE